MECNVRPDRYVEIYMPPVQPPADDDSIPLIVSSFQLRTSSDTYFLNIFALLSAFLLSLATASVMRALDVDKFGSICVGGLVFFGILAGYMTVYFLLRTAKRL